MLNVMGYLDLTFCALRQDRNPDWSAARRHLDGLSDDAIADLDSDRQEIISCLDVASTAITSALDSGHHDVTVLRFKEWWLFICGDPHEARSDVHRSLVLLRDAEALSAAGFEF